MDEFKPNSYKSKQESQVPDADIYEDAPTSVVSSKVHFHKRGVIQRALESLIVEDPKKAIANYVISEIKNKLPSAVEDVLELILDQDFDHSRSSKKKKRASKIKYRDYWDYEDDEDYYEKKSASSKSVLDFEEPIVESRGEAEALWETMNDILNSKKQLSIAVLYALVGSRDVSHTYYKYGWKHLPEKPSIIKVKEGFWIKLPRPIPLD